MRSKYPVWHCRYKSGSFYPVPRHHLGAQAWDRIKDYTKIRKNVIFVILGMTGQQMHAILIGSNRESNVSIQAVVKARGLRNVQDILLWDKTVLVVKEKNDGLKRMWWNSRDRIIEWTTYEYVTCHMPLGGKVFTHFKYYLYSERYTLIMIWIILFHKSIPRKKEIQNWVCH